MRRIFLYFAFIICAGCNQTDSSDEIDLKQIHREYVEAWLANDKQRILTLFTEDARLQPSSLCPIKGMNKIEAFWFPNDSSVTTIKKFETELLNLTVRDTVAFATHSTFLDWSYEKDTVRMNVEQRGISTSVYAKRNHEWKIWRQMWSDLSFKSY
jgi:ketosteroid isomerase-like protein